MPTETFDTWMRSLTLERWSQGTHNISPDAFLARQHDGKAILLDIRFDEEQIFVTFPQSLTIPMNELPTRWQEIPTNKLVAILCGSGQRATVAYTYLQTKGLTNVTILKGGVAMLVQELNPPKVKALLARQT